MSRGKPLHDRDVLRVENRKPEVYAGIQWAAVNLVIQALVVHDSEHKLRVGMSAHCQGYQFKGTYSEGLHILSLSLNDVDAQLLAVINKSDAHGLDRPRQCSDLHESSVPLGIIVKFNVRTCALLLQAWWCRGAALHASRGLVSQIGQITTNRLIAFGRNGRNVETSE